MNSVATAYPSEEKVNSEVRLQVKEVG